VATFLALAFGFVLPLVALARVAAFVTPKLVASGLVASLSFLMGYFCAELVHYEILNTRLLDDPHEWGKQWRVAVLTILLAALAVALIWIR
jgi:hypothetical protein